MELEGSKPLLQDDRLRFETLLSDLSARFVRLRPDQVDAEIERALREVTEFFHAHRCGLLDVFADQNVARLTHAWYADGVRRVPPANNCAQGFSWSFERLVVQKEAIAFNDLSELPPDGAVDLPAYRAQGVRSTLMIPLFIREDVRHIVVLQTMEGGGTLSPEYIPRLRLLAEIMVQAIERRDAEEQLRLALEEVRQLRDQLHQENLHLRREMKELRGDLRLWVRAQHFAGFWRRWSRWRRPVPRFSYWGKPEPGKNYSLRPSTNAVRARAAR
jgi:GAF domain-containing protein